MRRLSYITTILIVWFVSATLAQPAVVNPIGEGPVIIGQTFPPRSDAPRGTSFF